MAIRWPSLAQDRYSTFAQVDIGSRQSAKHGKICGQLKVIHLEGSAAPAPPFQHILLANIIYIYINIMKQGSLPGS